MSKAQANGVFKLKKPTVKQAKPGNWREGIVADCTCPSSATKVPNGLTRNIYSGQEEEAK
jgi:hypothetical protein